MARPLPYSETAECECLGGAIIYREPAEMLAAELEPEDFYNQTNAQVAEAIISLVRSESRVDISTVTLELERLGRVGDLELRLYVKHLAVEFGSANIARSVAEVIDLAARRRVILAARAAEQAARTVTVPMVEVEDLARSVSDAAEVPTASKSPSPTIQEFLDQPDAYDWLVPGYLERMDRIIITGYEGLGKSTLLRQLAVTIAAGIGPFGDGFNMPRRVLVLDCENGRAQMRRGFRPLVLAARQLDAAPEPGMLRVCSRPGGIDLAKRSDVRWIHERFLADQPEVVVMGPLYKLLSASPIEEEPAAKAARVLDTLRERFGCALIIEAHSPHAQGGAREMRPYGASLWMRWPEFGYGLVPDPEFPKDAAAVKPWRGPREERDWPRKLRRGGRWLWTEAE